MRMSVMVGMGCAALALGGCATVERVNGNFFVQPGKYQYLKCPELSQKSIGDSAREKELVSLMERANQDVAGPLINLTVYSADLQQVRADLEELQRAAHEKGCDTIVTSPKK